MRIGSDRTTWNLLAGAAAALAAVAARKIVELSWQQIVKRDPPQTPEQHGVHWREALLWGLAVGVAGGLSRTVGRRGAAAAWRRAKGRRPPGR